MLIRKILTQVAQLTSNHTSSDGCGIEEDNGFLKYRCPFDNHGRYRCHNTEEYYWSSSSNQLRGQQCSHDPHYYQACNPRLNGYKVTNSEILCGSWLCKSYKYSDRLYSLTQLQHWGRICDGEQYCADNRDETDCAADSATKLRICNDCLLYNLTLPTIE